MLSSPPPVRDSHNPDAAVVGDSCKMCSPPPPPPPSLLHICVKWRIELSLSYGPAATAADLEPFVCVWL